MGRYHSLRIPEVASNVYRIDVCDSLVILTLFIPNVFSHPYQLDESISNFRDVGWHCQVIFIQILMENYVSKQCRTDQTPRSDLILHCLPMSPKKDARLVWVNRTLVKNYNLDIGHMSIEVTNAILVITQHMKVSSKSVICLLL